MASKKRKINELTFKCSGCKGVFGMPGSKLVVKKDGLMTFRRRYCPECAKSLPAK